MSDQESRRAEREARRVIAARPTQSARHEHDLNRFLGSVYYEEVQTHHEQAAAGLSMSEDTGEQETLAYPDPDDRIEPAHVSAGEPWRR
ncbi:MAG: hypothetical protein ACM30G_11260 [Micromonosporaceae bacterium]